MERAVLQAELTAHRDALLTIVSAVDGAALALPTRNPDWAVRDVLAHVLACDADLTLVLEAASGADATTSHEEHQAELARWVAKDPAAMIGELRARGDRWRALLAALPDAAFTHPARIWWRAEPAALIDVIADWRGHDAEHAEDVRLALEERSKSRGSGFSPTATG